MGSDKYRRRDFVRNAGMGAVSFVLSSRQSRILIAQEAQRRPNILFFYPDQLRHDYIEPSPGIPVRTPNLKSLAGEGIRFTCAVTPSPLCAPARACLSSGNEYDRCRVPSNAANYPLDQPTIYRMLRDSGYHVMGCGKFDLHKPERDWGIDGKRLIKEWGFSDGIDSEGKRDATSAYAKANRPTGPYMEYLQKRGLAQIHVDDFQKRRSPVAAFVTPLPDDAYCDNWIGRNGLQLIQSAPAKRPWFLQVNFNGPHEPFDITAGMEKGWRSVQFPQPNGGGEFTPAQYNASRQNYASMIENIDRWIGLFLDRLKERGELENTLVIFSSDHGEMLGDHGMWGKSKPYQPSVGVPLIVWGPGVRRGVVCSTPSTTLDIAATVLDFAGIAVPAAVDSRSLRPYLEGKAGMQRDHILSGLQSWRLVIQDRYKYIRGYGTEALLFDLVNDPLENENIVKTRPAEATRLDAILDEQRRSTQERDR